MRLINENQFADMFLNEERHYPQFLDKLTNDVIGKVEQLIMAYIKDKIFEFSEIISVNSEYCNEIEVNIYLNNGGNIEDRHMYRAEYYNQYEKLWNGKLYRPQININIPINNGKYRYGYLTYVLRHELTHLYDDWMSLIKGGISINYHPKNVETMSLVNYFMQSNNDMEKGMAVLSYMSLKVERQAFLSQTVQELKSIGCGRFNYKEKLKETGLYNNINKGYNLFMRGLKNSNDEYLFQLNQIIVRDGSKSNIPKYDIKVFNPQQYRAKLRRWADNIYHQTMKRYGSVVSYYVDKLNEDYYKHNCLYVI